MQKGAKQKWGLAFEKHKQWNGSRARKIQKKEAEIIIKWLKDLDLPRYQILEIGCGNGYLGEIIIKELLKEKIQFTYHFTDLLPQCINLTRKNLEYISIKNNVEFNTLNVYEADKVLGKNSQNIIISTGFASAATYQEAVPIVSSILKKNGILICDFVNHLSPFLFITQLPHSIFRLFKYLKNGNDGNPYHFGKLGVNRYFKLNGLRMMDKKSISYKRNPLICMFKKL